MGGFFKDLTGQRFGRIAVIRKMERPGVTWWVCACDCGNEKSIRATSLISGHTKSCGCGQKDSVTKHGRASFDRYCAEYWIWKAMVRRTTTAKESAKCHKDYLGRGIKVCERWRSFESFLADMGERPSDEHSIDRTNNDGDYCPENCKWSTRKEQARNRRSSKDLTFGGETLCLTEWAEKLGMSAFVLSKRIQLGWTPERALTTSVRKRRK